MKRSRPAIRSRCPVGTTLSPPAATSDPSVALVATPAPTSATSAASTRTAVRPHAAAKAATGTGWPQAYSRSNPARRTSAASPPSRSSSPAVGSRFPTTHPSPRSPRVCRATDAGDRVPRTAAAPRHEAQSTRWTSRCSTSTAARTCRAAETNLRAALADLSPVEAGDVVVRKHLVDTVEEAERVGFLGSPTILIDGHDPFATPGATPGLSCRVYATDAGMTGSPTVVQLREALAAAKPGADPTHR